MNMLQLALLILGILIIVGVIVNAMRERRRDTIGSARWTPPSRPVGGAPGKGLPLGDQMDIFGSAAGEFDEFGVGRPRKVKEGETDAGPVTTLPPPAVKPSVSPVASAPVTPVSSESSAAHKGRKAPSMSGDASDSQSSPQAAPPPLSAGLLRQASGETPSAPPPVKVAEKVAAPTPPAPEAAAVSAPSPECVVVLFVAERQGQPVAGARIHAALKSQGLTVTPEKIYQRAVGDDVSFSIASLIKPGALDPAEAARFASPGLTLYLTVPGPSDPVAALEDLFITSDRLAGALDADVFDQSRQPLTAVARATLRQKVAAAAQTS